MDLQKKGRGRISLSGLRCSNCFNSKVQARKHRKPRAAQHNANQLHTELLSADICESDATENVGTPFKSTHCIPGKSWKAVKP